MLIEQKDIASGRVFVERDFYIDPPEIPEGASEEETIKIWDRWYELDAAEKEKHKQRWYKLQKLGNLPNFDRAFPMVKMNGIWYQRPSMNGLVGGFELKDIEEELYKLSEQES